MAVISLVTGTNQLVCEKLSKSLLAEFPSEGCDVVVSLPNKKAKWKEFNCLEEKQLPADKNQETKRLVLVHPKPTLVTECLGNTKYGCIFIITCDPAQTLVKDVVNQIDTIYICKSFGLIKQTQMHTLFVDSTQYNMKQFSGMVSKLKNNEYYLITTGTLDPEVKSFGWVVDTPKSITSSVVTPTNKSKLNHKRCFDFNNNNINNSGDHSTVFLKLVCCPNQKNAVSDEFKTYMGSDAQKTLFTDILLIDEGDKILYKIVTNEDNHAILLLYLARFVKRNRKSKKITHGGIYV